MFVVPFYKRLLSYFYPVSLWRGEGTQNPFLELLLYQNRYQLATKDALYSDGNRYRPLVMAFNALGKELVSVKSVLVLGTGLGSAVQILRSKNLSPSFVMVDNDKKVLELARHILHSQKKISFICADANEFVSKTNDTYDLVIVDVFRSRIVPGTITARAFLEQCKQALAKGKHLVLNYIITDEGEWERAQENINAVFPGNKILNNGINRIVIATV